MMRAPHRAWLTALIAATVSLLVGLLLWPAAQPSSASANNPYRLYLPLISQANGRSAVLPGAGVDIGSSWQRYGPDDAVPGRMLVRWRDNVGVDSITRINAVYGVQTIANVPAIHLQVLQTPNSSTVDLLAEYNSLPEVQYAEPDFIAHALPFDGASPTVAKSLPAQPQGEPGPTLEPGPIFPDASVNDPMFAQQYSLTKMSAPAAWDVSRGDGVVVAIVDTGADLTHPDLSAKFVSQGRDFISGHANAQDDHGHGTHVSGIVAASTNNAAGVAGVGYNAKLLPVKVLNSGGSGDYSAIVQGITWAADQGVKVINMSLGGAGGTQSLQDAVDYAWNKGVVVVCAAGNDGVSSPSYPAAFPNCISVVATDQNDQKASFSNYGSTVDISAPGVGVLSTVMRSGASITDPSGYQTLSGTSMATPNVAGVAALVWAAHPDWTQAQVRAALENTADNIGSLFYFGRGRVNAARAVGSSSAPTPTPGPGGPTATATPLPSPTPSVTPAPNDYAGQTAILINQQRAANGLPPLRIDQRLANASDFHNRWMLQNNCFDHICPGEPDPFQRMKNAGYPLTSGSENIGRGYQMPSDMVTGWMNSAGHRANILGNYTDIGCGFLQGASGSYMDRYWTCDFARGASGTPSPTLTATPTATLPGAPTRTATPTGPTATTTPGPPDQADWAARTFAAINVQRVANGLPTAVFHPALQRAAQDYSQYMVDNNCWSHYCNGTPWTRIPAAGYDAEAYSEVLARAATSPINVVQIWMDSPPHHDIIMSVKDGYQLEIGCGWDRSFLYTTCDLGWRALPTTPTPTSPPTATPTTTPTITPTSPVPGQVVLAITPAPGLVGWMADTRATGWTDTDLFSGWWAGQRYLGGIQFSLSSLPPNATLLWAQLELTGRNASFITRGQGATWAVRWLDQRIDSQFPPPDYATLRDAEAHDSVDSPLTTDQLGVGVTNTFRFTSSQVADMAGQASTSGRITFRIDGPTAGPYSNVMSWSTGYGTGGSGPSVRPVLRVAYITGTPTATSVAPATPTRTATATSVPPTVTSTATFTATPVPPTVTATATLVPPTVTPTATVPLPPRPTSTATAIPSATSTSVPPTATATVPSRPTATPTVELHTWVWEVKPGADGVGWVMTLDTAGPHLGDSAVYSGQWGQWRYYGLAQFSLPPLPSDATIIGAQLVLYTQSESNVNGGDWVVQTFAPDVDSAFASLSYSGAESATLLGPAGSALDATQLGARAQPSRFILSPSGVSQLQARLASTQKVTYRLDGANSGYSLQQWDSGYGYGGLGPAFKPVLRLTYTTASAFGPSNSDLPLLP